MNQRHQKATTTTTKRNFNGSSMGSVWWAPPHRAGLLRCVFSAICLGAMTVMWLGKAGIALCLCHQTPPPVCADAAGGPSPFSARFYGRKQNGRQRFNTPNAARVMERSLAKKKKKKRACARTHTHGCIHTVFQSNMSFKYPMHINQRLIPLSPLFTLSLHGFWILVFFFLTLRFSTTFHRADAAARLQSAEAWHSCHDTTCTRPGDFSDNRSQSFSEARQAASSSHIDLIVLVLVGALVRFHLFFFSFFFLLTFFLLS